MPWRSFSFGIGQLNVSPFRLIRPDVDVVELDIDLRVPPDARCDSLVEDGVHVFEMQESAHARAAE
jgi:hypothetical protein